MNTDRFSASAISRDATSRGFSVQEISDLLFKKFNWRASTSAKVSYTNEEIYAPVVFPEQIASQRIPASPPDDFVALNDMEIMTTFGISYPELEAYRTTINGANAFSILQSQTYPHLYKVENCLLRPSENNPDLTFHAISPTSNVNLLENAIQFSVANGAYKGEFRRTQGAGELSRSGTDVVKESHISFLFDTDTGYFTCYEKDTVRFTPHPITRATPPSATVYLYRGRFGLDTVQTQWRDGTNSIYFTEGQVLVGRSIASNTQLTLDVAGTAAIQNLSTVGITTETIVAHSMDTFSDRRLKDNITPLAPVDQLLNLSTYSYTYKSQPGVVEVGLIAQEVEAVMPQIVKEHNGFKSVQYDRLGALLLPVVKDQKDRIESLEQDIHDLKMLLYKMVYSPHSYTPDSPSGGGPKVW